MNAATQIGSAIRSGIDRSLADLTRLCAQPSIAAQGIGMDECANLVSAMLAERGFQVEILPSDGAPVVVAERVGNSSRTMLMYNHYDVQPPEPLDLWESPPFEPEVRDGKMYARGVSDDKGHIVCRLAAIDALLEQDGGLPCSVKFVIEGEEEIGSPNLPAFVKREAKRLEADACLWEFGGVDHEGRPTLHAGLRGIQYVELRIRTANYDAHSGLGGSIFPNPAWRLVWALSTLKDQDERIQLPGFYDRVLPPSERDLELLSELPDDSQDLLDRYGLSGFIKGLHGGPEFLREKVFSPTCTICGLTSGYQGSGAKTVQPAEASAKVDFRLIPDQRPEEVLEQLRQHLDTMGFQDIEIIPLSGEPPGRTDPDDPFIRMVAESAREVYGQPQLIDPMSGGSGPIYPFLDTLEVPVATVGVSYPGARIHAPNENIRISDFIKGAQHTALVLHRFGQS